VLAVLLLIGLLTAAHPAQATGSRYAALVIDAVSGEVFHEHNAGARLYPASLTKMMTLYLTFEALQAGRLTPNQRLPVSRQAAAQPPSSLALRPGATIRVEEAIYALVTKSANDVAVVLAEALGGSEARFAELMTQRARQLGMAQTTFRNASGLPHSGQRSTARDMARLAQAMIRDFPQYYSYFSTQAWRYGGATYRNHNRLLGQYEGMDGLKTGYIRASGFNLAASAVRGRLRLIAVVFGGDTADQRNRRVAALLDDAFASRRAGYLIAHGSIPFVPPLPPRHPEYALRMLADATTVSAVTERIAETRQGAETVVAGTSGGTLVAVRPIALAPTSMQAVPVPPLPPAARRPDLAGLAVLPVDAAAAAEPGGDVEAAGWGIQIGAFTDSDAGHRAIDAATGHAPDLLAAAVRHVRAVQTDQGALYRARLMGLDPQAAEAACLRLIDSGTACLTVAPDQTF
jgi:D-alanyl-D-alanine carboxypeptidase